MLRSPWRQPIDTGENLSPETFERLENVKLLEQEVAALKAKFAAGPAEELPVLEWPIILLLVVAGGLIGVTWLLVPDNSLFVNNLYWWIYPAFAAWTAGTRTRYAFANGLVVGILATVLQYLVLSLGFESYATLNPGYIDYLRGSCPEMDPSRYPTYMLGGIRDYAPAYGLLVGALSWIARRIALARTVPPMPLSP